MICSVNKTELLNALNKVKGVFGSTTKSSILSHLLVECKDDMVITARDYEVIVQVHAKANVDKSGIIAVPGKRFIEAVTRASDEELALNNEKDELWLEIDSGSYHLRLPLMDPDNMPEMERPRELVQMKIKEDVLREIIDTTSFAISTDDARVNINGLSLKVLEAQGMFGIEAAATDGKRLSMIRKRIEEYKDLDQKIPLLIHRRGVSELKKFLGDTDSKIEVVADNKLVMFRKGNDFFIARQIETEFPKYDMIIPDKSDITISLKTNPKDMLDAIKRVAVSAEDRLLEMHIGEDIVKLKAESVDGSYAEDSIDVEISYNQEDSKAIIMMYDWGYLSDALKIFSKSEQVEISITDDYRPTTITDPENKHILQLIMPVRQS